MIEENQNVDIEIDGNDIKVVNRLSGKQKAMLEAMRLNGCNISAAADLVGVSRAAHYQWLEKNDKYREAVSDLNERVIDIAESKLMRNINEGNQKAIEYFLDAKAKVRGYGQARRLDIGGVSNNPLHIADVSDDVLKEKLLELGFETENQLNGKRIE
jgi:hypothetical protein